MKNLIIVVLVCFSILASAETNAQPENAPFISGEKLSFKVAFSSALTGNITAGNASLKVYYKKEFIENNSCYHIVAEGGTSGFVEFFYNINEKFESYVDDETILPLLFTRRTRENNYKRDDTVRFNHDKQTAQSSRKKISITPNTRDVVSAFYYARMQDISNMKEGGSFDIPYFFDDTITKTRIVYVGKQKIKTKMGTFNCVVFKPLVLTGRVFEEKFPITFWITDDKNRIPILIESKLIVGKARIELTSYNGSAYLAEN